jgi:hypothetical protein
MTLGFRGAAFAGGATADAAIPAAINAKQIGRRQRKRLMTAPAVARMGIGADCRRQSNSRISAMQSTVPVLVGFVIHP